MNTEFKEAFVTEIFCLYREAGILFQKTAPEDVKETMDVVRVGVERMLKNLMPLSEQHEKNLEELRALFKQAQ
jgi:hypothetical protein